MLNNWYIKLTGKQEYWSTRSNPYDIMSAGYGYTTTACRLILYYDNPNGDVSVSKKTDVNYYASIDYKIAINPANLAKGKNGSQQSFANQIKNIIDKAEKLIHDPNNVRYDSCKYWNEYIIVQNKFTVDGSSLGIIECKPADNNFYLEAEYANFVQDMMSYTQFVKVTDVDINDLLVDVRDHLTYEVKSEAKQNQQAVKQSKQSASLLDLVINLSPSDMIDTVNKFLKRRKWSITKLIDVLVEDANTSGAINVANTFCSIADQDAWYLKDGTNAYEYVENILENYLTYDNGKPLSGYNDPEDATVWNDFFDHDEPDGTYRGDDYSEMFDDVRVAKVELNSNNDVIVYLDLSKADLLEWLDRIYGNYSYDRDFS